MAPSLGLGGSGRTPDRAPEQRARGAIVARLGLAFGLLAAAGLLVLLGAAVQAAGSGTSVTATKTSTGHLVKTYGWTLAKTVTPPSATRSNGDSASASYAVTATRNNGTLSAYFDGQICVTNTGTVATQGLAITDAVTLPPSKAVLNSISVSVAAKPSLSPGQTFCYPYTVSIPNSSVIPGDTYKDTATVTITNHSGPAAGPTPSATAVLPTTPGATNNSTLTVSDTNGSTFTFTSSGTQTYSKTFTCDADTGSHVNTVSAVGFVNAGSPPTPTPAPASATFTLTCLDPDVTVTKTASKSTATIGDTVSYTVTVSNIGQGTAHGASLSDTLPPNVTWSIDNTTDFSLSGSALTLKNQPIDLAAGASKTVHVSGTIAQAACETTLANTASVTASNEPATKNGNNSASASIAVSCVHIDVSKTADAATVSAGDTAGYVIEVSNSGLGTASNVSLTDTLAYTGGLDWSIVGGTGAADCTLPPFSGSNQVLSCSFGSLGSGASRTVHITSRTGSAVCPLTISNNATASASGVPSVTSATATITVQCPDVTVTKTADSGTISSGDPASFTITVSNAGPGTAHGVVLSDPLPPGPNWSSDAGTISGGTLTDAIGDLASGASVTIHLTGQTDASNCGSITNTATVSASNEPNSAGGNNSSSATIAILCPDVTVTKTADSGTISSGDPAAFTITVSNVGSGTAHGVVLSDPLPPGPSWSADAGTISGGTLTDTIGDLAPGASVTIHLSGQTDASNCGSITNTATVSASNEPGSAGGNNSSSATVTILCPDVTVTKTADTGTISSGDPAAFTITVSNVGSGTAHGVVLSDPLPAGPIWSSDAGTISGGTLTDTIGDLAPGASVTIHLSGTTDATSCGTLTNTATVTASNEPGSAQGNNTSTASVSVLCPDVSVTKTADAGLVKGGDDIGFVITVSNSGAGTAHGVTVSDTLPTDTGTSWSIDAVNSDLGCSIGGGALSCNFGDLAPGASAHVHITSPTTVDTCPDSPVDNTATASATNGASAGESSASITVKCNHPPVASDQSVTLNEDTPTPISLSATDADGDNLTFSIVTPPTHGTLGALAAPSCSGNPSTCTDAVTYTPAANYFGSDSFTFKANDGQVDSNTATVSITINAVNDPPVVPNQSYNAQANMQISFGAGTLLTGVTDADASDPGYTQVLNVTAASPATTPAGGTVTVNADGSFTFDPPPGVTGNVTFPFQVCDNGNPLPPACTNGTATVNVAGPVIWFVDATNGSDTTGKGTLSHPFQTIAKVSSVDAANQRIFAYAGSYAAGINLKSSEWLVGQGVTGFASFDTLFSITPPSGTIARPSIGSGTVTVGGTVGLGSSSFVRALTLSTGGSTGLAGSAVTSVDVAQTSVTTTTGVGVSLPNVSGSLTLKSVSSNGASSGINLATFSGSFIVTGDGSGTKNGTGGTIANSTGSGISLSSASGVSLSSMNVSGSAVDGILGSTVSGLTLTGMNISNSGSAVNESGIRLTQLTGTDSIAGSTVTGSAEDNIFVENTSGTLTSLSIHGPNCLVTNNSTTLGNDGVNILAAGTANMTATVDGCSLSGNRTVALGGDAGDSATLTVTFMNNVITQGSPNHGNQGIQVSDATNGHLIFEVENNKVGTPDGTTLSPLMSTGINAFNGTTGTAVMSGKILNNIVKNDSTVASGTTNGFGIRVFNFDTAESHVRVDGNTVTGVSTDYGILAESSGALAAPSGTQGRLDVAVLNNTVNVLSTALDAMRVQARNFNTGCARITGNTSAGGGATFFAIFVRQANAAIFDLDGWTNFGTFPTATSYIESQNPGVGTNVSSSGTITGVVAGTCVVP